MRRGLWIIVMLLLVPMASAVWDASTELGEYTAGDIISLNNGYTVRVLDVSAEEDIVYLSVSQYGKILDSGYATRKTPFIIQDLIMVNYFGTTSYQSMGETAKLQVSQWVDGKFVNAHFPHTMNLKSLYDVFVDVHNTGAKDARFTVELTQAGTYVRRADRYQDEYGNLIPRLVDAQLPFQDIEIGLDKAERVTYEHISPVRRQPSGNNDLERSADVLFNLYYKDTLLDTIVFPEVLITPAQSGYIEAIRMPSVLYRDQPEEIELDLLNAGPAYGGVERSKFNLHLKSEDWVFQRTTREFKTTELEVNPDLLRGDLPAYLTKTWKVKLTPYVPPGDYILPFDLEFDGQVFDTYYMPVEVRDGASTRITKIEHPSQVKDGENFPVIVTVANSGLGRKVSIVLESAMAEETPEHVLTMGPGETEQVLFNLDAMGSGQMRMDAKVILRELEAQGKNFDPYEKTGYEVNSKSSSVYVMVPGMKELPVEPIIPEAVQKDTEVVKVSIPVNEIETEKIPTFDMNQATPILVVALILLVILVILKAMFHFTED